MKDAVTSVDNGEAAIIELQLRLLAAHPDTLIVRKCGPNIAAEASRKAQGVLDVGGPLTAPGSQLLKDFDRWLREDGHRRNPGTTADLITACLFADMRDVAFTLSGMALATGVVATAPNKKTGG